jgi:D-sedoheptulose 7-phosphate isomerase
MNLADFCNDYLARARQALAAIDVGAVERVVSVLLDAQAGRKQIFVFGNGGSAATASHFACDINKGVSQGLDHRFRMVCLNDNVPTMLAYANDVSYESVFVEQLKNFLDAGDVAVGISGSGNSPNVLRAIEYAKQHGATTVGITGFSGGQLAQLADASVIAPVHDMQHVEDVQTLVTHLIMRARVFRLHGRTTC